MNRGVAKGIVGGLTGGRRVTQAGGGSPWFEDSSLGDLEAAFDVRDIIGASTLTLDADGAISTISDISGNAAADFTSTTGLNTTKALPGTDLEGRRGIYCPGSGSGASTRYRFYYFPGTTLGATTNDYHHFMIFSGDRNTPTGGSQYGHGIWAGGFNGRPYWYVNSSGYSNANQSVNTVVDGGGSQMLISNAVNFTRLCGRQTDGTKLGDYPVLVEWRNSPTDGNQQFWINGRMMREHTAKTGGDLPTVHYFGGRPSILSADYNYFYSYGIGRTDNGFTEAKAAAVRAALMSDFGIDEWDGSTYP